MMIFAILMMIVTSAFLIWMWNAYRMLDIAKLICDKMLEKHIWGYVNEVFDYHDPSKLTSWFGFKPHFYPYIMPTSSKD